MLDKKQFIFDINTILITIGWYLMFYTKLNI